MKISRVAAPACRGGESPLWDPETGKIYYVDNIGQKIHSLDLSTGATSSLEVPSLITAFVLRKKGGAIVALRTGIYSIDLDSGALTPVSMLPMPQPVIFNDGKVDCRGRFVVGAGAAGHFDDPPPDGGIFVLDTDRTFRQLDAGIHLSNGPCWSPDGKTFYFSDSWLRTVYAYDYDADTGGISGKRPFVHTGALGGLPDGATVDADGLYWVAIYQGGKIAAYRPDGKLERTIDIPVRLVSSVMFGGPKLDRLFVTTIADGHDGGREERDAGSLFVIDDIGVTGLPEVKYLG